MKTIYVIIALGFLISCQKKNSSSTPEKEKRDNESEIQSNYQVYRDISYGKDSLQTFDIHKLNASHNFSDKNLTIVFIHGGGFYLSDKSEEMEYVQPFLKKGLNVVNMNYRLKRGVLIAMEDITSALNFLADKNDTYQLDLQNVVLCGFSAGGSIAATLGLSQNNQFNPFQISPKLKVKAIVNFSGPVDSFDIIEKIFSNWNDELFQKVGKALFPPDEKLSKENIISRIQAITYFDKNDPNFFLWHGGHDNQVPPSTFNKFIGLLETDNKLKNKIVFIEGGKHNPNQEQLEAAYQIVFEFLDKIEN